jgi:hypothetical protein
MTEVPLMSKCYAEDINMLGHKRLEGCVIVL